MSCAKGSFSCIGTARPCRWVAVGYVSESFAIQSYLVYLLLMIWPFHWVKKEVNKNQKDRMWVYEILIL